MSNERANGPVMVVGAGPAGLATAAMLRARDVPAVVIERAEQVGASWRGHYDRLRLHTPRWLSHLPGFPIPRAGRTRAFSSVAAVAGPAATPASIAAAINTDLRTQGRSLRSGC